MLATGSTAALLAAFAGPAGASTTFTVDSSGDGSANAAHCTNGTAFDCTFRDAAAAAANGDTIDFDSSIVSISLSEMVPTPAVNIIGPADRQIAINKTDGFVYDEVFMMFGNGDVTVSGLAITGNHITLLNVGNKTIDRVRITGATAYRGGAIETANAGDLTITNSVLSGNVANVSGGAVYAGGTGNVTISNSAVYDNNALQGGGGAYLANTGTVTVTNSTFDSNSSSSLIHYTDEGGAILVGATVTGTVIANSTISGNSAGAYGGGIFSSKFAGPMSITNSTISGNSSPFYGGGVYFRGSNLTIDQSTITSNSAGRGGGFFGQTNSTVSVTGSIVSGNVGMSVEASDIGGSSLDILSDHSLIGLADTATFIDVAGTIRSSTPGLGGLTDNGGPTKTMSLLTGSAAIDAGPDPVATFVGNTSDQRGAPWLRVYNGTADIGAFEVQPVPSPPTSTTSTTVPDPTSPTTATDPTTTMEADPVVPAFAG